MAAAEQTVEVEVDAEEVLVPVLPITHTWAGRQFHFSDVTFNGYNSNAAIVVPGQSIDVSLKYRTSWNRGPDDYCPGYLIQSLPCTISALHSPSTLLCLCPQPNHGCRRCVVQLYYGLGQGAKKGKGGFSTGIVKSGIRDMHRTEHSQTTFEAPAEPGVYYITWAISLDYNFVVKTHDNESKNGIAMIRVLPKSEWTAAMVAPFVTDETRTLIAAFLLYCSRDSEEEANKMQSIPNGVAMKIAAHIMLASFEEMTQAQ